jgi:hypothetical protein
MRSTLAELFCLAVALGRIVQAQQGLPAPSEQRPLGRNSSAPLHAPDIRIQQPPGKHRSDFVKKFDIESFGVGLGPLAPGFEFSPGYLSAFYDAKALTVPAV